MTWGLRIFASVVMWSTFAAAQEFHEPFQRLDTETWHIAHYQFRHPYFDTDWDRSLAVVEQDRLLLTLAPQTGQDNRFRGASVRSSKTTGFGRYQATLQPAHGPGIVTGFFTYTGPHYGTRHDEIDIEFLGKNTRQIHIATFVDGKLWNRFIDLPFDATDKPRTYGFDWNAHSVRWYVDGDLIYELRDPDKIPQVPAMIFANIWAADPKIKAWSGEAIEGTRAQASVYDIRYNATNDWAKPGNS